jgi:hypothetical protein
MAQTEQNLANHAKIDPAFHGFLLLGALVMLIASIVHMVQYPNWWSGLGIFAVIWLMVLTFKVRLYALKVQDRVIRLEERLRLQALLSGPMAGRVNELDEGPGLVEKTLAGNLDRKAIKQLVQNWRADHWRV